MRAVVKEPRNLPHDRLLRDSIRGRGAQEFAIKADPGEYRVLLLHPDGAVDERKLTAINGRLTIPFAGDAWTVSGIVVKGSKPAPAFPPAIGAASAARPVMRHAPPATAQAESPLSLALDVSGSGVSSIRLYYRAVNQLAKFKMLEASPGQVHNTRERCLGALGFDVLLRGPQRSQGRLVSAGSAARDPILRRQGGSRELSPAMGIRF